MTIQKHSRILILQLSLFFVVLSNSVFSQNNMQVDSVLSKDGSETYLYKGYSHLGERVETWSGVDLRTDSIRFYVVYQNGYILKRYYIDPRYGPQLQFEVNKSLDTLTEYSYDNSGNFTQVFVWKIKDDSLLNKNCLTFCAKEEGAVVEIKRVDYVYDYFGVVGMTQVSEFYYGGEKFQHYFYKGKFVCTFSEKGKVLAGSNKTYKQIMSG